MVSHKTILRHAAAVVLSAPLAALAVPAATSIDNAFAITPDANVVLDTTLAHATVRGSLGSADGIAWFSFTGRAGGTLYIDHDGAVNGDTLVDSMLWLFRSSGELVGYGDDSAMDAGSQGTGANGISSNAFLKGLTLDAHDTYYLAVTSWGLTADAAGCLDTFVDPSIGGMAGFVSTGCSNRSFSFLGSGYAGGSFTLYVSQEVLGAAQGSPVPEPGSLALAGLGLCTLAAVRRPRSTRPDTDTRV